MHTPARLWLIVLTLLLAVAPAAPALAHAQLLSTAPADNAVLNTAPEMVALKFNEPVTPLTQHLIGPDGSSVAVDAVGGETVTVTLPGGMATGTHVLSYRVVSTDGHPIAGSLVFSIGHATGAQQADTSDASVTVALWAGKALLFLCLFVGVGGAVFQVLGPSPRGARLVATGLSGLGLLAAVATVGLQSLDALGLPLTALGDGTGWSAAFSTSYGFTAIVAGVAFLAAFSALSASGRSEAVGLGLFAGVLAALSLALSGHASAAAPQWLTRPAVFLHIGGVLFWIGALLPLWLLLRDRSETADRALAGFSRGIPFAVAPLVVSGLVLATIQLGMPGPQWVSGYGFILAAKLGLLVVLFGLAVWNRRALTAPALAGDATARRRLRSSIGFEMAIVIVILMLVAGWRFTPPPRAMAVAPVASVAAEPLLVHLMDDTTMAMLSVTPGQAGPVVLDIWISDETGAPKDAQAVSLTLASNELGIEPIKREAMPVEDGWQVTDLTIPLAGTWQVDLEVRISRFELAKLPGELVVP